MYNFLCLFPQRRCFCREKDILASELFAASTKAIIMKTAPFRVSYE